LTAEYEERGLGVVVPDADLIVSESDDSVSPDLMLCAGDRFARIDPQISFALFQI
jgi:hypothetical protein